MFQVAPEPCSRAFDRKWREDILGFSRMPGAYARFPGNQQARLRAAAKLVIVKALILHFSSIFVFLRGAIQNRLNHEVHEEHEVREYQAGWVELAFLTRTPVTLATNIRFKLFLAKTPRPPRNFWKRRSPRACEHCHIDDPLPSFHPFFALFARVLSYSVESSSLGSSVQKKLENEKI